MYLSCSFSLDFLILSLIQLHLFFLFFHLALSHLPQITIHCCAHSTIVYCSSSFHYTHDYFMIQYSFQTALYRITSLHHPLYHPLHTLFLISLSLPQTRLHSIVCYSFTLLPYLLFVHRSIQEVYVCMILKDIIILSSHVSLCFDYFWRTKINELDC